MDKDTRLISYEIEHLVSPSLKGTDTLTQPNVYVPAKGDKIWFYPGCDIPRFKVKRFCQDNDVAVVKYREKSSVRFMGPETMNEMVSQRSTYCSTKDEFISWLDRVMCNAYEKLKEDILACPCDTVYMYHQAASMFCSEEMFGTKPLEKKQSDLGWKQIVVVLGEPNLEKLNAMLDDPNLRHQDELLSLLNTGAVLDKDMYDQIHRLFASTDKENTKLAMEAMANCDFQQSAVYLLMLLQKYGDKISNSGIMHHVNFKSLLKYFQIQSITSIDVDNMIDSLRHQKLLSVTNLNMLMPMALQALKDGGEMRNIKIKDLELSPEAEAAIAENILDQQPEPEEKQEEVTPTV